MKPEDKRAAPRGKLYFLVKNQTNCTRKRRKSGLFAGRFPRTFLFQNDLHLGQCLLLVGMKRVRFTTAAREYVRMGEEVR